MPVERSGATSPVESSSIPVSAVADIPALMPRGLFIASGCTNALKRLLLWRPVGIHSNSFSARFSVSRLLTESLPVCHDRARRSNLELKKTGDAAPSGEGNVKRIANSISVVSVDLLICCTLSCAHKFCRARDVLRT